MTGEQVKAKAKTLDFPESVKSFFQGNLGQPHNGFPAQLRKDIIRDLPEINDRPGIIALPNTVLVSHRRRHFRKRCLETEGCGKHFVNTIAVKKGSAECADGRALQAQT